MAKGFKDSAEHALKYSFTLLAYRDRSEKELYERLLHKGFSEKVVIDTVSCLIGKGLIDDLRFAEALKRDAIERKFLGQRGIRNYLVGKGISGEMADAFSGDDDVELYTAIKFVDKKMRRIQITDEDRLKRKLMGMLARRGFSFDTIDKALKSIKASKCQSIKVS